MRRSTGRRWLLGFAILIATATCSLLDLRLLPLLFGVLGLLRGRVWGLLLLLVGSSALLFGELRGTAEPGAIVAGTAGLLAFLAGLPLLWRHDRSATTAVSLLGLALGAALSSSPDPGPSRGPIAAGSLEPVIAALAEPLFSPSAAPPLVEVCAPRHATASRELYRRTTVYDFADEPLQPLPFGPRVAERPRSGYPRAGQELTEMLGRRRALLGECYRWARSLQAGLEGRLAVELRCSDALPALSELATQPHRDAQRTGQQGLLRIADRVYRLILDPLGSFRRETLDLRYYSAELLFKLERFLEAAALYHEVALLGGKFAKDAAVAEVISLKNADPVRR